MADRIARRPDLLIAQLQQASAGITLEPLWPTQAPTAIDCTTAANDLINVQSQIAVLEASLTTLRQQRDTLVASGRETMQNVDAATDLIYSPTDARKANFGLPPLQTGGPAPPPPGQVVMKKIMDGVTPSSIFLDWESQQGAAAYEVEWFTSSAMTPATRVGGSTATQSETTVEGLTQGTQYWFRVRAVRASAKGPWSDPATRVAGV